MKTYVYNLALFVCLLFSMSCEKKSAPDCTTPPATLSFSIVNGDAHSFFNTETELKSVKISYSDSKGAKTYIGDLEVTSDGKVENKVVCRSQEIVQVAGNSNLTKFTIEIDDKDRGDFQVKTAGKTGSCGNWPQVSQIIFNGTVLQPGEGGYTFTIRN